MDYDKTNLAAGYDRSRARTPHVLDLWMRTISQYTSDAPPRSIVDLGCGTGRFSGALASHFGATVIAIDPSYTMLEHAVAKQPGRRVLHVRGRAEAIPLEDGAVDLIFMSMVFHHLDDPKTAARECRRILRDHGTVFLRAGTVERIPAYAYVPFFPETPAILAERLNTVRTILATFEGGGFRTITHGVVTQEIAPSHMEYVQQLAAGGDSVLARLSPEAFHAGLEALRAHAGRVDPRPVFEPLDFFLFHLPAGG